MTTLNTDPIIVIIATSNGRTNLLLERSLLSVYLQNEVNPHVIYVVDDNPVKDRTKSEEHKKIDNSIKKLRKKILIEKFEKFKKDKKLPNLKFDNFFHTTLIPNVRTKGNSGTGAWNTAVYKSLAYKNRSYYLAFLDDDDEWKHDYLKELYREVTENKLNSKRKIACIVAGFSRIEKDKTNDITICENNFTRDNFFIKNPGLQGSNLFILREVFIKIGCFDESLKSATDRDLAIRLIDFLKIYNFYHVLFNKNILVKHYAVSENRVTQCKKSKQSGLDHFYKKYWHQFSKEIQDKSITRAIKLFDYSPNEAPEPQELKVTGHDKISEDIEQFNLLIGLTSDNNKNLTELFKSFIKIYEKQQKYIKNYIILVVDNSTDIYKLTPVIEHFRKNANINIQVIFNDERKSIAENRTLLQKKMYEIGFKNYAHDFISWVIDDDHLFKYLSKEGFEFPNYFKTVSEIKNNKVDAILGNNTGEPALPFLCTVRTQLIDFYYSLTYFKHCDPEEKFNLNKFQYQSEIFNEYYYDLSRNEYRHLEYPYYYKDCDQSKNSDSFYRFLLMTAKLNEGCSISRQIFFDSNDFGMRLSECSIYRGGNTIIYNPDLLLIPNYTPNQKEYNRRSDFNWALINSCILKRKIQSFVLPLHHERQFGKMNLYENENKWIYDINGQIFYRLLKKILKSGLKNDEEHIKKYMEFYKSTMNKTKINMKVNYKRVDCLINLISTELTNNKNWWYKNDYRASTQKVIFENIVFLDRLYNLIKKREIQDILKNRIEKTKVDPPFLRTVIEDLKKIQDQILN